ncbi:MAG: type II toxin-antitoxin system VapC family toxin [Thermoleophilia bacterium]
MRPVLVDSNVILDVVTEDAEWFTWSAATLAAEAERASLVVNPVIYAEVSVGFSRIEDLEEVLPGDFFLRSPLPWEAAFLAGKAFLHYRRGGGTRRSPLPDFFIGAHAAVANLRLLTRDASRYAAYFPSLEIISP